MSATSVRDRLISLSLVTSGTSSGGSWIAFVGGLNDSVDAPQVSITTTTGLPPFDVHGTGTLQRPGYQLLVRGSPNTYAAASAKADAIWTGLHRTRFGSFLTFEAVNNPVWLGYQPDTNRPLWSLNFLAIKET